MDKESSKGGDGKLTVLGQLLTLPRRELTILTGVRSAARLTEIRMALVAFWESREDRHSRYTTWQQVWSDYAASMTFNGRRPR